MGSIIDITSRLPHKSGQAICLECKHEWVAVTPLDVDNFECPECGLQKGVFYSNKQPGDKEILICDCGSAHRIITSEGGAFCVYCGSYENIFNLFSE